MESPNIQDAILHIRDLPTLPSVLGRVLSTAADPESSAVDLGKLIASDQSLSATVLRLVNSAYYGFRRQINSVTQAIVMLGFIESRNLTLAATAFRTLGQHGSDYDRQQLWRHTIATATAAEHCARLLGIPVAGCFEAGLLHDIGKVVFDTLYPDEFLDAACQAHEKELFIREAETEVFGTDHAEVGGMLAEHWNLPEGIVESIRYHHSPEKAKADPKVTNVIAVANFASYLAQMGELSNGRHPVFPLSAGEFLNVSEAQVEDIARELVQGEEKIDEFLGALT